jgi:alkyl hydroperoxide reductase subunit F
MYELIVIGAGPAGMTATVYAARKRINTLLLSKDLGGQPLWTGGVENYMGYQYIEGPELMQKFEEQVKKFPVEQKIGQGATALSRLDTGFRVDTDIGETYQTKSVIIATGKRPRSLNVPGEELLRGRGVTYCAICDGPIFAGQKVVIVGGGNAALEAANDMVGIAEHVYLVSLMPLSGDEILIRKLRDASNMTFFLEHEVVRIEGPSRVEGIVIRDVKTKKETKLELGGVFVEIGRIPNSELVRGIAEINNFGEIKVDCSCETGITGLFAAGDVTNAPEKQIIIAAGECAKAALQAHRYLQRI